LSRGTNNTFENIDAAFCEVSQPSLNGTCLGGDGVPDCY
jgi:hypothetical protein